MNARRVAVALLASLAALPGAQAAANPLLGSWAVSNVPGDGSLLGVQCRAAAAMEFRGKTLWVKPGRFEARPGDSAEAAVAASLFGSGQKNLAPEQANAPTRVEYERDGDAWFVIERGTGQELMVIRPRGAGQMEIVKPMRCLLTRSVAGATGAAPAAADTAVATAPAAGTPRQPRAADARAAGARPPAAPPAAGITPPTEIDWGTLTPHRLRLGETTYAQARAALGKQMAGEQPAGGALAGGKVVKLTGVGGDHAGHIVQDVRLMFDAHERLAGLRVTYQHFGNPAIRDQRLAAIERRWRVVQSSRPMRDSEMANGATIAFDGPGVMGTLRVSGPYLVETLMSVATAQALGAPALAGATANAAAPATTAGGANPLLGSWTVRGGARGTDVLAAIAASGCAGLDGIQFAPQAVNRPGQGVVPVRYSIRGGRWVAEELDGQLPYRYEFDVVSAHELQMRVPADCQFSRRR